MPIISQFYGIIVSMFYEDNKRHNLPHVHVRYNEYKASYNFDAEIMSGRLPVKQSKLVEAWIIIHKEELITLWKVMKDEGETFKIAPLYRRKVMEITPDILEVKALENYKIYLKFENGEEKIYSMKDTIERIKYFNKLKDVEYFKNVKPRGDTVEWENGEDVAPENLYYDSIPVEKN